MLGSLIVFSGCFGTGTTNGEGDDEVGTTVINNYYNNTNELPERIAVGGLVFGDTLNGNSHNYTYTISTTAGQMMEIVEADLYSNESTYMYVDTVCEVGNGDTLTFRSQPVYQEDQAGHYYLGGSAYNCYHTIDIVDGASQYQEMSWSLVYSIHPVTVG
ncbi:MAG: hypothetical protein CXX81_00080 [Methanobacteriota archaeon]|nr:MAG: hypothetical protein CXX81_00080 [Euryarchaeota archaeon]